MAQLTFTPDERLILRDNYRRLVALCADIEEPIDLKELKAVISQAVSDDRCLRDKHGINPVVHDISTAVTFCERVSPDRNIVIALLAYRMCSIGAMTEADTERRWGSDVAKLVHGLPKVATLYGKNASAAVVSDNFRRLLMTFAEDIRVIIMMIVERLTLLKSINHHPDESFVRDIAYEANYLYAPLAHRLGLYSIKSELEDMSLKYTNRDTYTEIARQLNATKTKRDAYIAEFIKPVKEKLEQAGLTFDIKGRTKSIYSIWNKIKKQKVDMEHIYDLFAIRIILDTPPEREKSDCWMVYSLITDMYQPNPSRMKDWISIPKSNGYESLHITVYGPENKWVEVQIRTRRMDLVAEKGLAAHWRYKGIKSESNLDAWMNNVRDILEAGENGPMELMRNFKMDIYDKEVFVFTPKGDLFKLPQGATLLDFAFNIHSKLGCQCTGGRVNGKTEKLGYKLQSGDTVEIMTSSSQQPKLDWLNIVVTSKARTKIRQTINEQRSRGTELAKEMLQRRFKNRKIEMDESTLMKVIKKMGYKMVTDFFTEVAEERLDINTIIERYLELQEPVADEEAVRSASEFTLQDNEVAERTHADDILVIGENIKGLNYRLSKCCNPIYGDDVFGFISAEGVVKIHRHDCPNAHNIRSRYPYRVIKVRWSGKAGSQFIAVLRVVGNDNIGIVTNLTSIINKEKSVTLRSIAIDSNDGMFQGNLTVGVNDLSALNQLIKKLITVKGVKNVQRSN
ncbi:MAG: RelA/SpoT family protein [Muribaculaceae bacterium]|nr:RelA/SpoT family protein [Muribaculaceae bacterium]